MNTAIQTVTAEILTSFSAQLQTMVTSECERIFPGNTSNHTISFEIGRKYARLITSTHGQRSCYGFVDMTNGDLMKSASWKAPAKNFARGNIFSAEPLKGCGWSGVG